jgi:hypothetical protein
LFCNNGHDKDIVGTYAGNTCKSCASIRTSKWYHANKELRAQQNKIWYLANKDRKNPLQSQRLRFLRYDCIVYLGGICLDCGYYKHLDGFEFDHVPELGIKTTNISRLLRDGYGKWEDIQPELDKCQLVCGTCHNIRTAARLQAARATTILPKIGSERLLEALNASS